PDPAVMAVILLPDAGRTDEVLPRRQRVVAPPVGLVPAVGAADILDRMTRVLLDEASLNEAVMLQRSARLLAAEFADWVVVDVVRGDGLVRGVVVNRDDSAAQLVASAMERVEPSSCRLVAEVVGSGCPE